ncbi:unnamed protein product [Calicophoron daubneyi]|uniref:Uncharacterized protein n=1 Tax=Calicophoron daubneyi TaxID=300641 RepID=A0AAV2TW40_CALDB
MSNAGMLVGVSAHNATDENKTLEDTECLRIAEVPIHTHKTSGTATKRKATQNSGEKKKPAKRRKVSKERKKQSPAKKVSRSRSSSQSKTSQRCPLSTKRPLNLSDKSRTPIRKAGKIKSSRNKSLAKREKRPANARPKPKVAKQSGKTKPCVCPKYPPEKRKRPAEKIGKKKSKPPSKGPSPAKRAKGRKIKSKEVKKPKSPKSSSWLDIVSARVCTKGAPCARSAKPDSPRTSKKVSNQSQSVWKDRLRPRPLKSARFPCYRPNCFYNPQSKGEGSSKKPKVKKQTAKRVSKCGGKNSSNACTMVDSNNVGEEKWFDAEETMESESPQSAENSSFRNVPENHDSTCSEILYIQPENEEDISVRE